MFAASALAETLPATGSLVRPTSPGVIDYTLPASFEGTLHFSLDQLAANAGSVTYVFSSDSGETRDMALQADTSGAGLAYFDFSGKPGLAEFTETIGNVTLINGSGHKQGDSQKGGAIYSVNTAANQNLQTGAIFRNSGDITFDNNSVQTGRLDAMGGAIYTEYGDLLFAGSAGNNITFSNNKAQTDGTTGGLAMTSGGALALGAGSSLTFGGEGNRVGKISFTNNMSFTRQQTPTTNWGASAVGGAIGCDNTPGAVLFQNTGDILFDHNDAMILVNGYDLESYVIGGAIGTVNDVKFDNTGSITFSNNSASALGQNLPGTSASSPQFEVGGGALGKDYRTNGQHMVFSFTRTGDVSFISNRALVQTSSASGLAQANGGALLGQYAGVNPGASIFEGTGTLLFSQNSAHVTIMGSTTGDSQARGGALMLSRSNLNISGYADVIFSGNIAAGTISSTTKRNLVYGGAIYIDMYDGTDHAAFAVSGIGNLLFKENTAHAVSSTEGRASAYGGAIAVYSGGTAADSIATSFQGSGNAVFTQNSTYAAGTHQQVVAYGGAIYMNTKGANALALGGFDNVALEENTNSAISEGGSAYAFGGAVYSSGTHTMQFEARKTLSLRGNTSNAVSTGAMASAKGRLAYGSANFDLTLRAGQTLLIGNNTASAVNTAEGDAYANGGAFSLNADTTLTLDAPQISLQNNKASATAVSGDAEAYGGALFMTGIDMTFTPATAGGITGNAAWAQSETGEAYAAGGAIYANDSNLTFRADTADLLLSGNTVSVDGGSTLVANSIFMSDAGGRGSLHLGARAGHAVVIGDSIKGDYTDAVNLMLNLNERAGDTGTVIFTGRYNADTIHSTDETLLHESANSDLNASIALFHGTLVLEQGATLGTGAETAPEGETTRASAATTGATYTQYTATLDIDHATLAASHVSMSSGLQSIIRPGAGASIEAAVIDLDATGGFTIDLSRSIQPGAPAFTDLEGIRLVAETLNLTGGVTGIADEGKLEFYLDKRWSTAHRFAIFNIAEVGNKDAVAAANDEGMAQSNRYASSRVEEAGTYNGTWTRVIEGDTVYLVWTPDEGQEVVVPQTMLPEMAGSNVDNSLWSSASNLAALSGVSMNRVSAYRLRSNECVNLWAQGLGDFSEYSSRGTTDGYKYRGGGYAAGYDGKIGKNGLFGLAFGQLVGRNSSERYFSHIHQDSLMGTAYAGYLHRISERNALLLKAAATYGETRNRLKTHYSDGDYSTGKWTNDAWLLEGQVQYRRALNERWTLSPFAGIEWTAGNRRSFVEGGDKARLFRSAQLRRLSIPAGIDVDYAGSLFCKQWYHTFTAACVFDVDRKNPSGEAFNPDLDRTWRIESVRPARTFYRVGWNTYYHFAQRWTLTTGYNLTLVNHGQYHEVNLGAAFAF